MQGPLTLVAAPAGAGKSALLSSWIAQDRAPGPVAWLSLDADDADRRRFWRAVLEALARATGDDAVAALAVSPREPMSMDLVLPALVDALAGRRAPVVLVLDDFHEVIDAVHEDLERLARFPPPALRLVIVTRADPPIGLGRLRLDGSLTEIRAADLAFTLDEAGACSRALGRRARSRGPRDALAAHRGLGGGSAPGGGVAAAPSRSRADFIEHFAGTDATISDYLVSEVLARQAPELRDFLLRTSIVETLSAELADTLTGTKDGHAMLATPGARRRADDATRRARRLASLPPALRRAAARRAARAAARRGAAAAPAGGGVARRARRRRRRSAPCSRRAAPGTSPPT